MPVPPATLTYELDGDFVNDMFFDFWVPIDIDATDYEIPGRIPPGSIISRRHTATGDDWWCEVLPTFEEIHGCEADPTHVTGRRTVDICADLYGGPTHCGIVSDTNMRAIVATKSTTDALAKSGLTGFAVAPLAVRVNQSRVKTPDLYRVEITSRDCLRRQAVHIPQNNFCPFCGATPVVCLECKHVNYDCNQCGKQLFVNEENWQGPSDNRFIVQDIPKRVRLLEASTWDGSDLFPNGSPVFATRRAVDFFLSIHAAPFVARPISMDFRGASDEKRSLLERVRTFEGK